MSCRPVASSSTPRSFIRQSHIGRAPISLAPGVTFSFVPDPPPLPTPSPLRRNRRILRVQGPKGAVELELLRCIRTTPALATLGAAREGKTIKLDVSVEAPESREQKAAWGLTRQLVANAVEGVTNGHETEINLVGVGYRVTVDPPAPDVPLGGASSGRPTLNFKLGFSHPVLIPVPAGIEASTVGPTRLLLRGADKEALGASSESRLCDADRLAGQLAATIRTWRKPEPYRGKGLQRAVSMAALIIAGIFVNGETIKRKEVRKK